MTTEVYADLLFLINFSMDYLCLYICARVLHRRVTLSRMLIASSLGGLYSIVSLFVNANTLTSIIIDISICVIMCAIVFSHKEKSIRSLPLCTFLYVGISMMTGGAMTAIFNFLNRLDLPIDSIEDDNASPYIFIILAIISGLITLRSGQVLSKHSTVTTCTLKITVNGKEATFKALSDSGNLVKDPLSNKPVIVLDRQIFSKIVDISVLEKFSNGQFSSGNPYRSLRLIPIKTAIGTSMLAALLPDRSIAEIYNSKTKKTEKIELDTLVASSDLGKIADGCNAIIPAEIIKI